MKRKQYFTILGIFFITTALSLLYVTLRPIIAEELKYKQTQRLISNIDKIIVKSDINQETNVSEEDKGKKALIIVAKDKDFSVVIPKIGVNTKVIPNVDPTNSHEYQVALTKGVAHAKTSALPDDPNGNVFIFAHSSENFYEANKYNSVFYLLNKLEKGDKVYLVYKGKVIPYEVQDKQTVNKTDTKYMTKENKNNEKTVTLMSCWPPGTDYKRLIVVAKESDN